MSCTLTLKGVGYEQQEKMLFSNISLNLTHKKKVAIVGANGSGKSTLLKIAAGLKEPSSGHVELFHNRMETLGNFEPYRHQIGYLFQDSDDQFIAPSVVEDVAFGLLNRGYSKEEARCKVMEKLDALGIVHLAERVPMRLSGGEKKLVALAGVLITEPDILLLDEPDNGLDSRTEEKILEILVELHSSMLIVSHERRFLEGCVNEMYELGPEGLSPVA